MDANNRLNLRWNDHTLTFVSLLDHFRRQELYCDASLACAGGGVYPVHKVVLSACSEFFASIFASASCQNPVVVLQDVGRAELESLLAYVYRGEVHVPQSALSAFLKVAKSLQVKGLTTDHRGSLLHTHQDPWCVPPDEASPHENHYTASTHLSLSQNYMDTTPLTHLNSPSHTPRPQIKPAVSWKEEGRSPTTSIPQQAILQARRGSLGENETLCHPGRRSTPPRSYPPPNHFGGTFGNLVASDECQIKKEPTDECSEMYDAGPLTIYEKEEEEEEGEEDEEGEKEEEGVWREDEVMGREGEENKRLLDPKVTVDSSKQPATPPYPTRTPTNSPTSPPHHLSVDTSCCSTSATTPSQLRRELLKPLHRLAPPLCPSPATPPQQSIPHPVIASREHERQLREPPPLMKIPPPLPALPHPNERLEKTSPSTTIRSPHLLVTTQPTYRSHLLPPTTLQHTTHLEPFNGLCEGEGEMPLNLSQDPESQSHHQRKKLSQDPFLGKILTNRKRRLRGPKSWEYLVRLLRDPTTNPSLIRWENEAGGVFRLVQPAAIAQRWGRRTGKHASDCLSYENFARGLRYHYATGALEPVSERSFVYKFGPKALGTLQDSDISAIPYT